VTDQLRYPWRCGCGHVNDASSVHCDRCGAEIGPGVEWVGKDKATEGERAAPPQTPPAAPAQPAANPPRAQRVVVVDFDMPFGSLVMFFVKCAFAAIPAGIIISVVYFILSAILLGILRGV